MNHNAANLLTARRLTLVTGHYGSGKTECSVNLALACSERSLPTALADLDIVNPYFRSREQRAYLESKGIRVVAPDPSLTIADVPALPPEISAIVDSDTIYGILDVGGDPIGSRVLSRFRHQIARQPYQMLFVLNASRPQTSTPERALSYLRAIEETCGLSVTAVVNNTHLCDETGTEDILRGASLAREVCRKAKLPLFCHMAEAPLAAKLPDLPEPVLRITRFMKKPWEL